MTIVESRKIGLHHIAFFRSFFEGSLDIRKMAERYLETGSDIVAARETLKHIQDAFVAAALRQGKDKEAQWLVLPKSTYRGKSDQEAAEQVEAEREPILPDFSEWSEEFDRDGFYSEQELIEIYSETFADEIKEWEAYKARQAVMPSPKVISSVDLNLRINLINDLSAELVSAPSLDDSVFGWFAPAVAQRLVDQGLHTLGEIVAQANEHGFRWFRFIPKLGEKTATKIVQWLNDNNEHLEGKLHPAAVKPIRTVAKTELVPAQQRFGITTLENLHVPHPLAGHDGSNRADLSKNKLTAQNDYDAIHEWLSLYAVAHTFQAYRKEAERLLLWALCERGKPLSSLTTADMNVFFQFLANPPASWCSDRRYERYHEKWRPFVRPADTNPEDPLLSPRSIRQARAITSTMFEWLVSQQYLDSNPVRGLPELKATEPIKVNRSFTRAQWRLVVKYLSEMPCDTVAQARIKFLIPFAYSTGLRRHELANSRIGHLKCVEFEGSNLTEVYMLDVVGKGQKFRTVPVPRITIAALQTYLEMRGLSRHIGSNDDETPLISSLRHPAQQVTTKTVGMLVKDFFAEIAATLDVDSEAYRRFVASSTHWLRHTYGSHAVETASLPTVQENMGHSSLNTTSIYIKSEDEQRYKEMEAFMQSGFNS